MFSTERRLVVGSLHAREMVVDSSTKKSGAGGHFFRSRAISVSRSFCAHVQYRPSGIRDSFIVHRDKFRPMRIVLLLSELSSILFCAALSPDAPPLLFAVSVARLESLFEIDSDGGDGDAEEDDATKFDQPHSVGRSRSLPHAPAHLHIPHTPSQVSYRCPVRYLITSKSREATIRNATFQFLAAGTGCLRRPRDWRSLSYSSLWTPCIVARQLLRIYRSQRSIEQP